MAEGCPAKCAKFLLIAFNIIFWLSGAALLGVGIWLLVDDNLLMRFQIFYVDGDDEWFKYAAYVLIGVGAFTFITGFAGCCGAIRESPCLLGVYIFLLVIVMLVEIAAGVLAFVFKNEIESAVYKQLGMTFEKENYTAGYNENNDLIYSGFGTSMNLFQQEIKCCGINGTADYELVKDIGVFPERYPYSCCPLNNPDDRADPQAGDKQPGKPCYTIGCAAGLMEWLNRQSLILIGLGIGIACLEIFGIIFAVCVCRNPSSEKYD